MKTKILLSTLLISMILGAGCAGKSSDIVDETKTVQDDTAGAKTTEGGTITSKSDDNATTDQNGKELNGENQDQNVQDMTTAESKAKTVYFDFDKFFVRADMQEAIEKNAELLKDTRIRVEGNCDEWGSDEYNFALGLKRANSVKKALVAQGLSADKISPLSLGEGNPVCTNKTQECWQNNRRVDFKVLP